MCLPNNFYIILMILTSILTLKINLIATFGRMYKSDDKNEYYIESEQKYIWVEALISCMEMNMTLVTIETSSKSYDINRLVKNTFGTNVRLWVGGIMTRYPRQHFIWLSTGKRLSYTFWSGSNPDFESNIENCLQIGWNYNMEWNDRSCNYQQGFICEHNKQHIERENLQKKLQQETIQQQTLQKSMLEIEKREKTLQQELDETKKTLQHLEEQELDEKIKLKQQELEESEKREKLLQQELESIKNTLKQMEEKNLEMKVREERKREKLFQQTFKNTEEEQLEVENEINQEMGSYEQQQQQLEPQEVDSENLEKISKTLQLLNKLKYTKDKSDININMHFHQNRYFLNILNKS